MNTKTVVCTLVMLRRPGKILLARGKKGVSKGFWNGYGGKVDEGETIEEGAVRELAEESGGATVALSDLKKIGTLQFVWESPPDSIGVDAVKVVEVHAFFAEKWQGGPQESESFGPPQWFDDAAVPYDAMFPGERDWLPPTLAGNYVEVTVNYYYDAAGEVCVRRPT